MLAFDGTSIEQVEHRAERAPFSGCVCPFRHVVVAAALLSLK
jgi:hypothetical protein